MSKFAIFDNDGFPSGFYSRDIHGNNIPIEAVEITDEQWLEFINNSGMRRWDGEKVIEYTPPPPPPYIPRVVSRFQARAALYGAGLLDDVETAIAAADPLVRMAWADAQEFQRNSPTILAMASALGLSESDVDELFITASGIVA